MALYSNLYKSPWFSSVRRSSRFLCTSK